MFIKNCTFFLIGDVTPEDLRTKRPIRMFRTALMTALSLTCMQLAAQAHDAWIEVDDTTHAMTASVFVGHAPDVGDYALDAARLSSLNLHTAHGTRFLLPEMMSARQGEPLPLPAELTGPAILSLTTFRSRSELASEPFNAYAAEEGITPILDSRLENGDLAAPGTEVYSRFLKALILPEGDEACGVETISQPVGHVLEILPLTSPGAGCSETLQFQLLYFGLPVEGATLHINRTDEMMEPVKLRTNEQGMIEMERPDAGDWYIHAAWAMSVNETAYNADFATSFASLSFALD
tara:strand:- start:226514 stop:227392 length:879 start_codon:yes stop_codon:yes gene_type:complete